MPFPAGLLTKTLSTGLRRRRKAHVAELARVFASGAEKVRYARGCSEPSLLDTTSLYSFTLMPWLGQLISRHGDGYLYLPTSIRSWPDQETFARLMAHAGFAPVEYRNLFAGIATIHVGVRPSGAIASGTSP